MAAPRVREGQDLGVLGDAAEEALAQRWRGGCCVNGAGLERIASRWNHAVIVDVVGHIAAAADPALKMACDA